MLLLAAHVAALAQFKAEPVTDPNAVYELGGYSIRVPQGEGWFLMHQTNQSVFFGRRKTSPTHAFAATAVAQKISRSFAGPEQFLDFVKTTHAASADPARESVLENEAEIDTTTAPLCVKYRVKTEDRGMPGTPKGPSRIMITQGITCIHPTITDLLVNADYSERGTAEELDKGLQAEGEVFLKGLKLINPE